VPKVDFCVVQPAEGVCPAAHPRTGSAGGERLLGGAQASARPPEQAAPEELADLGTGGGEGSKVFLFNCDCHSFEEVITQLLKAVPGMTRALAEELAWRAHMQGLAEVYRGGASECDRVAKVLGETGLIVQVL
jgi:ATP-dependent Clp protease adaptor protein ClpS